MAHNLITLNADGTITVQEFAKSPDLASIQKVVGGYIETVPYFTRYEGRACVAYCNEDGKLNSLPINTAATKLWAEQPQCKGQQLRDVLVGPIAIIQTKAK